MAKPTKNDLRFWTGTLFNKDDWDYNFSKLVSWLADGTSDLVVGSIRTDGNGIDLNGAQLTNVGAATEGSQAINLDQANTLLNRSSNYYPFSVASGEVDGNGKADYIQKISDTEIKILAGNTHPDLVCVSSDGTIESVTTDATLTVPSTDGVYHIIKEKGNAISLTGGANKVTIGKVAPTSPAPSIGDYFLDNSTVPFVGRKYLSGNWADSGNVQPFCYLGYVKVSNNSATVYTPNFNDNWFDFNVSANNWVIVDASVGGSNSTIAAGTYTMQISSYLPNDGCYYECMFRYDICASNSGNTNCNIYVKDRDKDIFYLFDSADGSSSSSDAKYEGGQFIALAKSTTTLDYILSHSMKSVVLKLIVYRKTNTGEI